MMNKGVTFALMLPFLCWADTKPVPPLTTGATPAISKTGLKKIQENLNVLDQNIKDVHKNLSATQQNLKTIELELNELNQLEKEHLDLRKRYDDYSKNAHIELEKNDRALLRMKKLQRERTAGTKGDDPNRNIELDMIQKETLERERWREDANKKLKRVEELQTQLNRNLREIEGRRIPLREELKSWIGREQEFHHLVKELENKKAHYEEMAKK